VRVERMGVRVTVGVFVVVKSFWMRPRGRPGPTHPRASRRTGLYPTVTPRVAGISLYSPESECCVLLLCHNSLLYSLPGLFDCAESISFL